MATATREYKVIGTRPIRHDGVDKVTGRAVYGADMSLPGMLYAKVLRSPHAHARIKSIDISRAEAHPEVRAVVTSADLPDTPPTGPAAVLGHMPSENLLARDKA
ncbi:MAG: xanthine dehydrogenase family protein molybdopterin-binding subunit, partial [Chloroflexi bacterium]|nr:xanthine dehydrogenase family protein molybdopterin-binding subunit [Chloroflexota bacterium]